MPPEHRLEINFIPGDKTIDFASKELEEYLGRVLDIDIERSPHDEFDSEQSGIWVGEGSTIDQAVLPVVADETFDDAIFIETKGRDGVVCGNSPRATLLAVYRYLRELGCRWIRPGDDGEIVPSLDLLPPVSIVDTPSQRHRGITIEGAVNEKHVLDMIDWAPKVGFNSYFFQFFHSKTFFEWWYDHAYNPYWESDPPSIEQIRRMHGRCVDAVEKRGLVHHAVGHGWTARALGLDDVGWEETTAELSDARRDLTALVDGERGLHNDIPTDTELCFSNRDARARMIEEIVEYTLDNPEVDVLHVWISDGHNNHCECEECLKHRPADLYVMLLNELAAEFDERNIETRIAFLAYLDLLWPPESERLRDPDRFHLMFAPIFREYTDHYGDVDSPPSLPPFERNDLDYPVDVAENVSFLDAWTDVFEGDAFLFDYHLWRYHLNDPGEMNISETLAADMQHLSDIGLNGNLSAQTQRVFMPSALSMAVLARTLWDDARTYDEITENHLRTAFGADWQLVDTYLTSISEAFQPLFAGNRNGYDLGGRPESTQAAVDSFDRVPAIVAEFLPVIERNRDHDDSARAQSWKYLDEHVDICLGLASALSALSADNQALARDRWEAVKELVQRREKEIHRAFDVFWFIKVFEQKFDGSA